MAFPSSWNCGVLKEFKLHCAERMTRQLPIVAIDQSECVSGRGRFPADYTIRSFESLGLRKTGGICLPA